MSHRNHEVAVHTASFSTWLHLHRGTTDNWNVFVRSEQYWEVLYLQLSSMWPWTCWLLGCSSWCKPSWERKEEVGARFLSHLVWEVIRPGMLSLQYFPISPPLASDPSYISSLLLQSTWRLYKKYSRYQTHVKGDDADLDGKSIVHPDHPLALVVVKGIKSPRIPEHMPPTTVVCCSVAVVPGWQLWMNYQLKNSINFFTMLRKQYPHQKLPNVSNIENLHSLVSLTCTGAFLCPLQKVECFLPPLCLNPSVSLCSGQRRWQTTWGCSASRSWSRIPLRRRLPDFKRSNPS